MANRKLSFPWNSRGVICRETSSTSSICAIFLLFFDILIVIQAALPAGSLLSPTVSESKSGGLNGPWSTCPTSAKSASCNFGDVLSIDEQSAPSPLSGKPMMCFSENGRAHALRPMSRRSIRALPRITRSSTSARQKICTRRRKLEVGEPASSSWLHAALPLPEFAALASKSGPVFIVPN